MKANCRLCQYPGLLRESHIIPRFVFQWMKDTGPGALRQATKPNIRRQDGLKERILCEKSEQLIGQDEKRFAERVFRPVLENPREEILYDEFLIRFAVSLAWRVLVTEMGRDRAHKRFDKNLSDAELEWRQFLLRKGHLEKYNRFHIFLTEILQSSTQPISNLNQYLTRFTDGCVAMSESSCAIFVKFSRFVFWSEISEFDPSEWVGTRIICSAGILKEPQDVRDGRFGNFLLHRAKLPLRVLLEWHFGTSTGSYHRSIQRSSTRTRWN